MMLAILILLTIVSVIGAIAIYAFGYVFAVQKDLIEELIRRVERLESKVNEIPTLDDDEF